MQINFQTEESVTRQLFGEKLVPFDSVNELFELELALLESRSLTSKELISRSAFFKKVNESPTNHYLLCKSSNGQISQDRSAQTNAYFEEGKYSTGYTTHGLFPYRGKFHPQLVKGLLNIIGIKEGETVLDPMCGSGTLNVEASLLGIHSIGIDVSPFCCFMARVKCQSLSLSDQFVQMMTKDTTKLFEYYAEGKIENKLKRIKDVEKKKVYELALLAYLDAMGYARRVIKAGHKELFEKVLNRYQNSVLQTIKNPIVINSNLGKINIFEGDASSLSLEDSSVDSIITSPPYSFAIDYAENDAPQLEYLGYDVKYLRSKMLGLKGKNKSEKLQCYFDDMRKVVNEIVRVLKSGKFAIFIIGSNTNQTGGIRLEKTIIEHFEKLNTPLVKSIMKPIKGMRNTMKEEYILIFRKQ